MAKRSRGHTGAPENTTQPKKRQKVLPTMQMDAINGSASPESPLESDSESVSDGPRYHTHGNCDSKKWNEIFDNLIAFKEEHGHCRVPQHYKPNIYLSQWVKRQRYYRKHRPELLSESRIQKLDELGFVWDAQEDFWKTRFEELKTYKHMHGHCNVPCKHSANQKLATWVKCQRRQYKLRTMGKPSSMTEERIFLLEELGFVWKIRGPDIDDVSLISQEARAASTCTLAIPSILTIDPASSLTGDDNSGYQKPASARVLRPQKRPECMASFFFEEFNAPLEGLRNARIDKSTR
eukprot:scaffold8128_cov60-Cylindrotheca_fusiformis.AAC.7